MMLVQLVGLLLNLVRHVGLYNYGNPIVLEYDLWQSHNILGLIHAYFVRPPLLCRRLPYLLCFMKSRLCGLEHDYFVIEDGLTSHFRLYMWEVSIINGFSKHS